MSSDVFYCPICSESLDYDGGEPDLYKCRWCNVLVDCSERFRADEEED